MKHFNIFMDLSLSHTLSYIHTHTFYHTQTHTHILSHTHTFYHTHTHTHTFFSLCHALRNSLTFIFMQQSGMPLR